MISAPGASAERIGRRLGTLLERGKSVGLIDTLRAALTCARVRCACLRGKMLHCPAHNDTTPSLSARADGRRVLLHCFGGCSQREVIDALRMRGLWPSAPGRLQPPKPRSVHDEALALARRQTWARPGVLALYRAADAIRRRYRLAERLRRAATSAGDCQASWNALANAARLEREAWLMEIRLDEKPWS